MKKIYLLNFFFLTAGGVPNPLVNQEKNRRQKQGLSLNSALLWFVFVSLFNIAASNAQYVLNNGKVRIGNGYEDSVNEYGNLKQPFLYNQSLSAWQQLTYADYPLDNAFAVGGSGAAIWNANGSFEENPYPSNYTVDYSQYISTGVGMGHGKIISKGNINVGGNMLRVENTYSLTPSASFVQISCKVTNIGSTNAVNVRTWIGTRDDYIGYNDGPTKTRGNLINDQFVPLASATQQSKALKVESGSEGVLFYTTSSKAYTIIADCCSFSNATDSDPFTNAITHHWDGSYALYVRFNDLAPGQSDDFSTYYAAGATEDLEDIIEEVAQASGALTNITSSSAVFTSSSATAATGYYIAVPAGSAVPTPQQIAAGANYANVVVANSGSAAMAANAQVAFNLTGLSASTTYTLYFVTLTGSTYSTVFNANFTTIAGLSTSGNQNNVTCHGGANGFANVTVTGGTAPFTYLWNTTPVRTTAAATGLTAGTYIVTVTDANNLTATRSFTITEPNALILTPSQTNVSCNGGFNATATISATGGTGAYTYSWSPSGGTNATASGLTAGTY
ncbi:SprB repeat-containing protein, partial [Flavobacterium selenitireducens]|uniref:SprB repeat-containing protein n=1 Tax=Flavobacterium selenitireducens TaxID=2722704 RepID=UPI00168B4DA5